MKIEKGKIYIGYIIIDDCYLHDIYKLKELLEYTTATNEKMLSDWRKSNFDLKKIPNLFTHTEMALVVTTEDFEDGTLYLEELGYLNEEDILREIKETLKDFKEDYENYEIINLTDYSIE